MKPMRVTLLGTGTSGGVPSVGCHCEVCRSTDPRDHRLRCVALVETENTRLLIDCGPDIRQQLMPLPFEKIDGVLLTHEHYDHVGGLDDLRPFCTFGSITLYGNRRTLKSVRHNMPYCFPSGIMQRTKAIVPFLHLFKLYPGVPLLEEHRVRPHHAFSVGDIEIMPIEVMHGKLPIMGYRIGKLAYITDMKTIADSEMAYLQGVDTLIVNALRFAKPHHSHQTAEEAVRFARRVGARRTFLIHESHDIGLYAASVNRLPADVQLAYDGMVIEL